MESYIEWTLPAEPDDREDWPRQHAWLLENLESLHAVFQPLVQTIV